MTVTMRNWESTRKRADSRGRLHSSFSLAKMDDPAILAAQQQAHDGPELLLTPIVEYISNRDDSPARSRFRSSSSAKIAPEQSEQQRRPFSLSVSDIMVVSSSPRSNTLNLTTISSGFFEFTCQSDNGYDILLAFLQASLDPERIVVNDHHNENNETTQNVRSGGSSVSSSCFDIDALQAQHLEGRAAAETWPEKLSRRVGHVFQNLSELSGALCDGACCPPGAAGENRTPPEHGMQQIAARRALEIDDNSTDCSPRNKPAPPRRNNTSSTASASASTTADKRPPLEHLPSGLSVEPDPETISTS